MVRILIVDDNALFRTEAIRLCESEGFEASTAGSFDDLHSALESAPDLVLMDVDLPTIQGHRLGSMVRSRHQVPICLVSALPEDKLRRLFESSDADAWIAKPLTREKLVGAVTHLVYGTRMPPPGGGATEPQHDAARILLVEDDAVLSDRVTHVLGPLGSVVAVPDGEQAISHLHVGRFDAILLDMVLPRLSGFDVIRHLMMHRPELLERTIVMTGVDEESLQFVDPTLLHAILRKPFHLFELAGLVSELLEKRPAASG